MSVKKKEGSLTAEEKRITKALLSQGWRNQDIQDLINRGRIATINSARITEVKKNNQIKLAKQDEVEFFIARKNAFDPNTGLNLYDHERLIRSREAMILAVHSFNSPTLKFKTEQFAVQANIAWTYLLHEYFSRKGVSITEKDGRSLLLSKMIRRRDSPLSKGVTNNIRDLIEIRDTVEHKLLRRSDQKFFALFQANCLNFDKVLCELFGQKVSLQNELSLALQFAKLDFQQVTDLQKFDIPEHIQTLDARLNQRLTNEEKIDLEYQFKVIYTLDNASKSKAHFEFIQPGSEEGKQIQNVLEKRVIGDDLYPHKPGQACKFITEKSGQKFTSHNHTQAWHFYKVRPTSKSKQPGNTNKEYCIYHSSHGDYTYNDKWIAFVADEIKSEEKFNEIKSFKLK
ncbi:DUF3644 domain-containing protein [Sneathiella chinensis]|uniref:DUF3644 domain-containing protein n=1 Tax=Sneathiella chinensis TaxID=349750 RepID=A0ABQ5U3U2_9PROT|nr:DUF3644 domain-containing protein [Sneathiella chinensis]GLQ05860.1 hypothetical protein GCM10007924_10810 [Sneathiella chinensis]